MPPFIIILYVFKNKYGYFLICANIIVSTRCLISSGYSSAFASNSVTSFFVKQNFKFIYYKNLIPYSFLIAASGLSFIARFAGKYPASTPTSTANTMDISTSHHGI